MLDELLRYYQAFTLETISQAPNVTGLYAWYAALGAGPKDWELDVVNGSDVGIERLRGLLKRQTDRLGFRTLEATAIGSFSQTWTGMLSDQTSDSLREVLAESSSSRRSENYDRQRAPKLQESLDSRDSRLLLVKALDLAIPCLSSPIYVGVAENLNSRLSTHARDVNRLAAAVARNPNIRQRLREETRTSFAIRAIASGFLPSNLRVCTLNLDLLCKDLEVTNQDSRAVGEAVEWILNRWNRPYIGKR